MRKFRDKLVKIIMVIGIRVREKTFYSNNTRVKYLLFKGKSKERNAMIICFSAYNKGGALYNYVRSLRGYNVPRLYIKDDFGPNQAGSYYLGEKGKHNVEPSVIELINEIKGKLQLSNDAKLIFIGSSKGGYAALNFGVEFDHSYVIVGAPQYRLGDHLNEEFFFPMLEDIFGNITDEKIDKLNDHIRCKYVNKVHSYDQKVYIQYSPIEWSSVFNEYTYEKHICHLISDIQQLTNIQLSCEEVNYKDHNDVHLYFPKYLKQILDKLVE